MAERDVAARPAITRGVVLAGGGARGAYEVGVLSYLLEELPEKLLLRTPFRVLCGTSVGAVHACYLAATAHRPRHDIRRLMSMWESLELERMLRLDVKDVLRLPLDLRALLTQRGAPPGFLLHHENLRRLVAEQTPWASIRDNLRQGLIEALTVTATHIVSGRTVVFVDRHDGQVPPWTRDRRVIARAARMGPQHALASASIPFLFPAVRLDGNYYCDGGLRQNTPLSPALRLGVDRVLVIGLRYEAAEPEPVLAGGSSEEEPYPGPFLMAGKIMDALMLDHLDYDLARLKGFNTLLRDGRLAFGESFDDELNGIATRMRGVHYRDVHATVIRPSRDIGEMATEFVFSHKKEFGRVRGFLLEKVANKDRAVHSDLLSYLLFDGRFARQLIALGRADADAHRERLIDFVKDA